MEYVSELEKMMPAVELDFEPTPGFGPYKRYLEHAVAHPAKANTLLLEYLILNFTKEGDVVLDPMAGSGSTGVVAALHNRNAVCVDIEEKFFKLMEMAREKVEKEPTLTPKGRIVNILGDARRLSELLSQADVCITSPPYLKSADSGAGVNRQRGGDVKIGCSSVGRTVTHPDGVDNVKEYGEISAIITSPPYSNVTAAENPNVVELQRKGWVKGGDMMKFLPSNLSGENIGKMGGETYLEAMFKVYSEMWKVLKPGGLAVIMVRPFVRDRKVVDLPYHTWLLLEKAGFKLEKLFKLRLKQESFWRILYYRRFPNVPRIAHEYVLVTRKWTSRS